MNIEIKKVKNEKDDYDRRKTKRVTPSGFFERWKDYLPMYNDFLTPEEVDDFPKIPTMVIEYSENMSKQAKLNWASFGGVQDVYSNKEGTMFFLVNKEFLEAKYLGCFENVENIEIPKRIVTPDWYECLVTE